MKKKVKEESIDNSTNFENLEEDKSLNNDILKNNEKQAMKVSVVSLIGNFILSLFKLVAGLIGFSYAMVADAIHSFSDVFTTIIVMVGMKISSKKADKEHPYGHDRFECVAALILAFILFDVGLLVGYTAIEKLISGSYLQTEIPKTIALIAAVVSIVWQFIMFVYARNVAKKINSGALKADAWHHLSDSLSSIGSLIGIAGAMLGAPILDVIAGLVICLLIIKVAIDIFIDSVNKMTDKSASEEVNNKIKELAILIDGVKAVDMIKTRQFGNMFYIDIEISCDPNLNLKDAHQIAQNVHDEIEKELKLVKHCLVHVNPFEEKE